MEESFVCTAEFNEFREEQKGEHKLIADQLVKLAPLADPELIKALKESAKLKVATDKVVGDITRRAKVVAVFLGIIAVLITIVIQIKTFIGGGN